jgi:hypothetical protein
VEAAVENESDFIAADHESQRDLTRLASVEIGSCEKRE